MEYPAGNDPDSDGKNAGQAGWEVGTGFTTFNDLATNLTNVQKAKGAISRLAINLHGAAGIIDADSVGTYSPPQRQLYDGDDYPEAPKHYNMKKLREKYSGQLRTINSTLTAGATVLFHGCNVAMGPMGERFLKELSKEFFPGKTIVAFKTVQYFTMTQRKLGSSCTNPGSLDSDYTTSSDGDKVETERMVKLLKVPLVWASEKSSNAKIAKNGVITAGEEKKPEATDYSVESYLPGAWIVSIGTWNGVFVFAAKGQTCWWSEDQGATKHQGTWNKVDGEVQWSFADEPKGWQRVFHAKLPLGTNVKGEATINGVNHGYYGMAKTFAY